MKSCGPCEGMPAVIAQALRGSSVSARSDRQRDGLGCDLLNAGLLLVLSGQHAGTSGPAAQLSVEVSILFLGQ